MTFRVRAWRERQDQRSWIGETGDVASISLRARREAGVVVRLAAPLECFALEAFLVSTGLVAVAEIGDKTQLLAVVLAARFRKPVPIILGILVATILNHALAAGLGVLVGAWLKGPWFSALVGLAFIAMAIWALVPDKDDEAAGSRTAGGVFLTTLVAFFLVEIGDKTQIATTLLAARYHTIALVAAGTTLGMMAANIPAVFLGEAATRVVPLAVVRTLAAGVFALIGLGILTAAFLKPTFGA